MDSSVYENRKPAAQEEVVVVGQLVRLPGGIHDAMTPWLPFLPLDGTTPASIGILLVSYNLPYVRNGV